MKIRTISILQNLTRVNTRGKVLFFSDVYEHIVELRPRIQEDGEEGDHCWNFIFIFLGNDNNNIIKLILLGKYAL